jgi:AmmeMemoRadiSam system protein B
LAASDAEVWRTPLGDVPLDPPPAGVPVDDSAHRREHALEVQLPFLVRLLEDPRLLPLAVGTGDPQAAADLLEPLWADPSLLLVCSTDLSHYLDQTSAQRRDERTAEAVVGLDVDRLGPHDACGVDALRALLVLARRHGGTVDLLDLRTSADTAGDAHRVVGYGAFALRG